VIGCNNVLLPGVAAESPAIAGCIVTVVTREGWGEGAGLRSSYRQASSNPHRRIEGTVEISSRTSRRCRYCAKKAPCTRTERRELSPAESPLFLRSPTSLAGLSFLVAFPRRSLRSSRQVYAIYYIPSSSFLLLLF
jgi:hypothetical protein